MIRDIITQDTMHRPWRRKRIEAKREKSEPKRLVRLTFSQIHAKFTVECLAREEGPDHWKHSRVNATSQCS